MDEISLKGGRSTFGVVKVGETVRRPHKETSGFVNDVLLFLHKGFVPDDIGNTTIEQLCIFMKIVRRFHDLSTAFVNMPEKVLCHNDLSPCNTVFREDMPIAIIDWDSVSIGERWQDLTYILWLWINIGSHKRDQINIIGQMKIALAAYGADEDTKIDFAEKLLWRMDKVFEEMPETNFQYKKTKDWIDFSKLWVNENKRVIKELIG